MLRVDPTTDIPIGSPGYSMVQAVIKAADDGTTGAELADIGSAITELSGIGYAVCTDPIGSLIGAGLGFLVDVVQPLDDLLGMVTGNPERLAADIAVWRRVAQELRTLAHDVADAGDRHLVGWQGTAADAARQRLGTFAVGVTHTSQEVDHLASALELVKSLMEVAQSLILSIIGSLVEWLVLTWTAALLGGIPTGGGSTAAAAIATEIEAGVATSRGVRVLDRTVVILERIGGVLNRLKVKNLEEIYKASPKGNTYPAGSHAPGFIPLGKAAYKIGLEPVGVLAPAIAKGKIADKKHDENTKGEPDFSQIAAELEGDTSSDASWTYEDQTSPNELFDVSRNLRTGTDGDDS